MKLPIVARLAARQEQSSFIAKLLVQTQLLFEGTQAVEAYMLEPTRERALHVRDIERRADAVRRALIQQLKQAFITPIDREDLFSLSRALDDVLDALYSTTREMYLLGVVPSEHLIVMVKTVQQCAQELHGAIRHLESNPTLASRHALRVRALENRMDTQYMEAMADLFRDGAGSLEAVVHILKMREVYGHMMQAVKSAERAGDLIDDILVKFN